MHLFRKGGGFGAPLCFFRAVTPHAGADSDSSGGATAAAAATAARGSPGSGRSVPPVSEAPLAPGSEREAGAQLFSARIGPEGADVTRLLGALLGGDDAPLTAREQLYSRPGTRAGLLGARLGSRNEGGQRTESHTGRALCPPEWGPESRQGAWWCVSTAALCGAFLSAGDGGSASWGTVTTVGPSWVFPVGVGFGDQSGTALSAPLKKQWNLVSAV